VERCGDAATASVTFMRGLPKTLSWRVLPCFSLLTVLPEGPAWATASEGTRAGRETVTVVTSAVTPFFGAYYLEGAVRTSDFFSVLLNTSYLSLESDDWRVRAGTVGFGADYFFAGSALRGWYAEAIGEVWFSSWRHEPSTHVAPIVLGYAAVAIVGYQFVCDLGAVLDIGAGATAFHVPGAQVPSAGAPVSSDALTRIYPAAKVDLGWAF
jgi:hypothetical protein